MIMQLIRSLLFMRHLSVHLSLVLRANSVNGVIPALLAGNSVILKHSPQTPLCGEIFDQCLKEAGLPAGVFQSVVLDDAQSESVVKHPRISFVNFTGSVAIGKKVQLAAASSGKFMGAGMELGGKDPAYVLADCD